MCIRDRCVSLWSSWSPACAICQTSSTVSSRSSPRHLLDPCIFCSRTNSLEFTARLSEESSVDSEQFRWDLRHICLSDTRGDRALEVLRNRALQIDIYIYIYITVGKNVDYFYTCQLIQREIYKSNYSVSGKKRQNYFCNIFYKIPAILMKSGTWFPE